MNAMSFHPASNGDAPDAPKAMRQMPRYVSHKTVAALEIKEVGDYGRLKFVELGYAEISAPKEMFTRYQPKAGDFYVVYDDGYQSFSPRKAFLEGYTRDK
jgi:hypothetical protein